MYFYNCENNKAVISFRKFAENSFKASSGSNYVSLNQSELPLSFLNRNPSPSFRESITLLLKTFAQDSFSSEEIMSLVAHSFYASPVVSPIAPALYLLNVARGESGHCSDFSQTFMLEMMHSLGVAKNALLIGTAESYEAYALLSRLTENNNQGIVLCPQDSLKNLYAVNTVGLTEWVQLLAVEGDIETCKDFGGRLTLELHNRRQAVVFLDNNSFIQTLAHSAYLVYAVLLVYARSEYDCRIEKPNIIVTVEANDLRLIEALLLAKGLGVPIKGIILATHKKDLLDMIFAEEAVTGSQAEILKRITAFTNSEDYKDLILGCFVPADRDIEAIRFCQHRSGYICDPASAVAIKLWEDIRAGKILKKPATAELEDPVCLNPERWQELFAEKKTVALALQTAHPALFPKTMYQAIGRETPAPSHLQKLKQTAPTNYPVLKNYQDLTNLLGSLGILQ